MHSEAKELKAFLDAIQQNPRDVTTRKIFADWLDEHDEPELADEQRNFSLEKYDAEKYLQDFADRYNDGDLEDLVKGLLKGEHCFSSDFGPEEARENHELWYSLKIFTGKELPKDHVENARFRCAC